MCYLLMHTLNLVAQDNISWNRTGNYLAQNIPGKLPFGLKTEFPNVIAQWQVKFDQLKNIQYYLNKIEDRTALKMKLKA